MLQLPTVAKAKADMKKRTQQKLGKGYEIASGTGGVPMDDDDGDDEETFEADDDSDPDWAEDGNF